MDEDHATLQSAWANRLRRWGWLVWVEVSFNHYGDRGRVDLVAWHPILRILCVVEIKTQLADAQGTLGPLDVKVRVGRRIASSLGLPPPRLVVPVLIVRDTVTNRRRLGRVAPLFDEFAHRGRAAIGCLRHPERITGGMLILSDLASAPGVSVRRVGRERIRLSKGQASAGDGPATVPATAERAPSTPNAPLRSR